MSTTIATRTLEALKRLAADGATTADLLREIVRRISTRVASDGWCGLTLDPATLVMTGGIHEHGLTPTAIRRLLEIEYGEDDKNLLVALAQARSPAASLALTAGDALERSPRYRDVLVPSGYTDELRVVLRSGGAVWGALVLFRNAGQAPFTGEDAAFVALLSAPGAEALRWSLLRASAAELAHLPDRSLLVLGPDNTLLSSTPAAAHLLEELAEDGPADPAGVPQVVQSVALEARRVDRPDPDLVSRSRARTRSGHWVTLHAAALGNSQVAVFVEPSRPLEVASLILQAYGLTPREGDVVRLVLHGLDTAQIAELLAVSAYTVQDHLKSVFDKVGVGSRKELVARVFFTHYLPRMQSPIGPDGWFANEPLVKR